MFFEPYQLYFQTILQQLKAPIKTRINNFLSKNFVEAPVITIHHRHGNGEIDDFSDKASRLNRNNTRVIHWMAESVDTLAAEYGIAENYRILFASDSPEMTRMFADINPRVFAFELEAKEVTKGKGFLMPGWQGPGRSINTDQKEKKERCLDETLRAFIDMILLSYGDMFIVTKRSSFTLIPATLMAAQQKPVCTFQNAQYHHESSFTCTTSANNIRKGLMKRRKELTGLADSSRRP